MATAHLRSIAINTSAVVLAAAVGWFAWPGGHLFLALLMPAAVFGATTRLCASLAAFAYYGAAAAGLPAGAAVFFGGDAPAWLGWMLWGAATSILTLPWTALWSSTHAGYEWRAPLALIIAAVPPVGLVGWANPLTAAGLIYPGWGWTGLAFALAAMAILARLAGCLSVPTKDRVGLSLHAVVFAALASLSVLANTAYVQPRISGWAGMDTRWGFWPKDSVEQYRRHMIMRERVINRISAGGIRVLVLPESALGTWTPATAALWGRAVAAARANGTTLVMGAEVPTPGGGYRNSLLVFERDGIRELPARVTAPISMWKLWTDTGAAQDWFGSGVAKLGGHRAAYLICYEQLLVWPLLISMAHQPEILIAAANDWWARNTGIPELQRSAVTAWANLLGVPYVMAVNR